MSNVRTLLFAKLMDMIHYVCLRAICFRGGPHYVSTVPEETRSHQAMIQLAKTFDSQPILEVRILQDKNKEMKTKYLSIFQSSTYIRTKYACYKRFNVWVQQN